jgi:hypothetical protein
MSLDPGLSCSSPCEASVTGSILPVLEAQQLLGNASQAMAEVMAAGDWQIEN